MQNGRNDRKQGNKQGDHSNSRRGPANEPLSPPLPDPEPPKVTKPKTVAQLLNLSSRLPDPVICLLQTNDWHAIRQSIENSFVERRSNDAATRTTAERRIAEWIRRAGNYRNGFVGENKCILGHHMTACIGQLERGVDTSSPDYQYAFVTGKMSEEEP